MGENSAQKIKKTDIKWEKMAGARQKIPGKREPVFPGIFHFSKEISDMDAWPACCLLNIKTGIFP